MKKIIAVVLATIALAGCGSKEEVYVCESSKFTVSVSVFSVTKECKIAEGK